ncbi:MAG: TIGR00282 family metallophosphoesterase [Patescibacteria group bacterium]
MKILFFGDIVGKIGRQAISYHLPDLIKLHEPDLVLANGENLAHGMGLTEKTILEMQTAGINFFSTGNHVYDNTQGKEYLNKTEAPVLKPANLDGPGNGYAIIKQAEHNILFINLLGKVFIDKNQSCPFKTFDIILQATAEVKPKIIIVDFHAEATSEKQTFWYYVNGRASAVLGTHTHVATANPRLSSLGTALVEDVGMVGGSDTVLGDKKESIINRFLTGIKTALEPTEQGPVMINAVLLNIDDSTGKTTNIKRIDLVSET